jgi:hypothetical protein
MQCCGVELTLCHACLSACAAQSRVLHAGMDRQCRCASACVDHRRWLHLVTWCSKDARPLCVQVEDGCLPSFETRANFVEYATEAAPADQSALRKQGSSIAVIGFAALAAAAAAANM